MYPDYAETISRGVGRAAGSIAGALAGAALAQLHGSALLHAVILVLLLAGYLVFRSASQPWLIAWIQVLHRIAQASPTGGPTAKTGQTGPHSIQVTDPVARSLLADVSDALTTLQHRAKRHAGRQSGEDLLTGSRIGRLPGWNGGAPAPSSRSSQARCCQGLQP